MTIYKMMLSFERQSQIAYVEADSREQAAQKCRALYDGQRFAHAKAVTYFAGPFVDVPGVYADIL